MIYQGLEYLKVKTLISILWNDDMNIIYQASFRLLLSKTTIEFFIVGINLFFKFEKACHLITTLSFHLNYGGRKIPHWELTGIPPDRGRLTI
jgi:hypothetical protein